MRGGGCSNNWRCLEGDITVDENGNPLPVAMALGEREFVRFFTELLTLEGMAYDHVNFEEVVGAFLEVMHTCIRYTCVEPARRLSGREPR
jgi:hypothetical protein